MLWICSTISHILFEKPHSLSYQAEIFPMFVPTTFVKELSTIAEEELWLKSIETNFSDVISIIFLVWLLIADWNAELIFSLSTFFTLKKFGLNLYQKKR